MTARPTIGRLGPAVLAAITLLAAAGMARAQTGNPSGAINDNLGEMDYGVCRGTDPRCFHDWPRAPTTQYRILVYTKTGASRHANLGKPLAMGLNPALDPDNVAQAAMVRIAQEQGWAIDYTEDVSQLASLSGYNAVIFLSTSRDALDDTGKTALRQYIHAGGGSSQSTMRSARSTTGPIMKGCWAARISTIIRPRVTATS